MINSVSAAYRYKNCKNKKTRRRALAIIKSHKKSKKTS